MADAATRREARRKRILENSENRLQRITGTNFTVREDNKSNSFIPSNPETENSEHEIVPDTNAHPDPSQPQSHIFDKTYLEDVKFLTNTLSNNDLRKRNTDHHQTNHTVMSERFTLNERQPNTVNKATNEFDQDVNTHDSIRRVSTTQPSLSYIVFSSKWILVLLAAFINVLYMLQLQHLCGSTILAPFFTLMLVRLHLADGKSESQGGSMLSAALILCNIKPELVYNLRWVMRIFKKITEEFSIYIFSFVILYSIACSYWNDIDLTISTIDLANNEELQ